MFRTRQTLGAIAAGMLGSLVTVLVLHHESDEVVVLAQSAQQANTVAQPSVHSEAAQFPARVASSAVSASVSAVREPAAMSDEDEPSADLLERRAQEKFYEHQTLVAQHDREQRDTSWADQMEKRIDERLRSKPENASVNVEHADCRSRSCAVVMKWKSRAEAQSELMTAIQLTSGIDCASRITLPTEEVNGDEFRAIMLFDCKKS